MDHLGIQRAQGWLGKYEAFSSSTTTILILPAPVIFIGVLHQAKALLLVIQLTIRINFGVEISSGVTPGCNGPYKLPVGV